MARPAASDRAPGWQRSSAGGGRPLGRAGDLRARSATAASLDGEAEGARSGRRPRGRGAGWREAPGPRWGASAGVGVRTPRARLALPERVVLPPFLQGFRRK